MRGVGFDAGTIAEGEADGRGRGAVWAVVAGTEAFISRRADAPSGVLMAMAPFHGPTESGWKVISNEREAPGEITVDRGSGINRMPGGVFTMRFALSPPSFLRTKDFLYNRPSWMEPNSMEEGSTVRRGGTAKMRQGIFREKPPL